MQIDNKRNQNYLVLSLVAVVNVQCIRIKLLHPVVQMSRDKLYGNLDR